MKPAPLPVHTTPWRKALLALGVLGACMAVSEANARTASMSLAGPLCERPARPQLGREYVVAAIGDSLTDQRVGGGRYLSLLKARCPKSRFDAYGVGGQRTDHMRWRFMHDVFGVGARQRPPAYTHVIVLGGVNDLSAGSLSMKSTSRIRSNLSYMYSAARERNVAVVALTLPPWGLLRGNIDARVKASADLNQWILGRSAAREVDHSLELGQVLACGGPVGTANALCPEYRMFPSDLIHWNERGHQRVAELLLAQVFSDCR